MVTIFTFNIVTLKTIYQCSSISWFIKVYSTLSFSVIVNPLSICCSLLKAGLLKLSLRFKSCFLLLTIFPSTLFAEFSVDWQNIALFLNLELRIFLPSSAYFCNSVLSSVYGFKNVIPGIRIFYEFFYFNPSKVLCSCSGFSFSSFFFFVIPWIRNTFFLFYHERFHSFIWFVIDIQTAFLLLFLFQLLKYNHYANRALHQGNQDQLANNDLLDYHQGNGLN